MEPEARAGREEQEEPGNKKEICLGDPLSDFT
jgi:hypothetical protein